MKPVGAHSHRKRRGAPAVREIRIAANYSSEEEGSAPGDERSHVLLSRTYAVVLEPDVEGGFTALVPALPGVVTEGESAAEALTNAEDAIRLCLEDLHDQGSPLPPSDSGARLERVEIAIIA